MESQFQSTVLGVNMFLIYMVWPVWSNSIWPFSGKTISSSATAVCPSHIQITNHFPSCFSLLAVCMWEKDNIWRLVCYVCKLRVSCSTVWWSALFTHVQIWFLGFILERFENGFLSKVWSDQGNIFI